MVTPPCLCVAQGIVGSPLTECSFVCENREGRRLCMSERMFVRVCVRPRLRERESRRVGERKGEGERRNEMC